MKIVLLLAVLAAWGDDPEQGRHRAAHADRAAPRRVHVRRDDEGEQLGFDTVMSAGRRAGWDRHQARCAWQEAMECWAG
jgi:hypothetical protein